MSDENYPDFNDPVITEDPKFAGIAWYPTCFLRLAGPAASAPNIARPILQQIWQTKYLMRTPEGGHQVKDWVPYESEWRDVPYYVLPKNT